MTSNPPRVVGILAGGGSLPREIAERVRARGERVHIVAIAGEADAAFASFPVTVVGWGEIGAMVRALRSAGCTELVIVGSVRRPDLAALRPDMGFFVSLPAILRIIAAGGDDSVLTRVVRFFEQKGFRVVAPAAVAPELLVGEGPMGRAGAEPDEIADATLGFDLVHRLGPFDVGQAVVVAGGTVEAIEGAEGTDAMLARIAHHRRSRAPGAGAGGVLVKRPKPGQELRIDLPAIGPGTVERAAEAGLAGIAVLAGGALAAERANLVRRADETGLFVQGFAADGPAAAREPVWPGALRAMSRRTPNARQRADATKGAGLLTAIAAVLESGGAIVDNGHVLAVEAGEGVEDLIARAGALRQWGRRRLKRRAGVAVLRAPADLAAALSSAAGAGLAGIAILGEPSLTIQGAAREADRLGLFLAELAVSARTT